MTLRLTDHRPPHLPRATHAILVNRTPAADPASPVPDQPISTDYVIDLSPARTTVTIQTDTWNPSQLQEGGRNEDLGLKLESITLMEGGRTLPNNLAEDLPPPPYYPQPRWYYDPGTHHLADLWPVYLLDANIGRRAALSLALPVAVLAITLIFFGTRFLVLAARPVTPET
jgi:hypothetical protein